MNLDEQDAQTISSYIRASRPDYKGPVFVDLSDRAENLAVQGEDE